MPAARRPPRKTARTPTRSGWCSGTTRRSIRPATAARKRWFVYHLGRRLQRAVRRRRQPARAAQSARYLGLPDERRPRGEPDLRTPSSARDQRLHGRRRPARSATYAELKDDGSTACGCWIYSGIMPEDGREPRPQPRQGDADAALGWGFAWPANRRILYNRASADPDGNPWSRAQSAGSGGTPSRANVDRPRRARLPGRQSARTTSRPPARRASTRTPATRRS